MCKDIDQEQIDNLDKAADSESKLLALEKARDALANARSQKTRLTLTYIFNIFDLIVTMYLVRLFGLSIEGNPIGRWLISSGFVYLFKIGVVGIALIAIWLAGKKKEKSANIFSWLLLVVYLSLVVYHGIILIYI